VSTPLPSAYLPGDFATDRPVAIIAGQRDYPVLATEAIRAAGVPVRLIALKGETEPELIDAFPENERVVIKVGQVGKMLKALQKLEAGYALFVGQINPGKLFRDLTPDLKAVTLLASLKERNAHTIFGALAREVNAVNVEMLDARAFMDAHLASTGAMRDSDASRGRLEAVNEDYLEHGIRMAREMAALDVGQGVVVRKGTVLAVEAYEGTDDMLSRANKYKTDQLIFVKCAKPTQNPYFDWPVFGEKTLQGMTESGIRTAALEADKVVMLNKQALLQKAATLGIQLIGF
jgi:DUF1009 family protein